MGVVATLDLIYTHYTYSIPWISCFYINIFLCFYNQNSSCFVVISSFFTQIRVRNTQDVVNMDNIWICSCNSILMLFWFWYGMEMVDRCNTNESFEIERKNKGFCFYFIFFMFYMRYMFGDAFQVKKATILSFYRTFRFNSIQLCVC